MLTKEQERKARLALLPTYEDLEKAQAYANHNIAKGWFDEYGLPYRVALDFLKGYRYDSGHPYINPCYPLPGYPKDKLLLFIFPFDFDTEPHPEDIDYTDEDGIKHIKSLDMFNRLKPEQDKQARAQAEQFRKWHDTHTPEWEYYFFHFFANYDFDKFTEFDFIGTNGEMNNADLSLLQKVYSRYRDEYLENPDKYFNDEPTYTDEELKQYTECYFDKVFEETAYKENKEIEKRLHITHPNGERIKVNGIDCVRDNID